VAAAGARQIEQNDADHQGGFDAFAECDEERSEHQSFALASTHQQMQMICI
jgi:hypothetical protein